MTQTTRMDQINEHLINAQSQMASVQGLLDQVASLMRIEDSRE